MDTESQQPPSSSGTKDTAPKTSNAQLARGPRRGRGGRGGNNNSRNQTEQSDPDSQKADKKPKNNQRRTFNKAGDSVGVPQPGKFPIVFAATAGPPKVEVFHLPYPAVFYQGVRNIFEILVQQQKMLKLNAVYFNSDDTKILAFKRRFEATSMLVMAQQIIVTKFAQKLPYGDLGPLLNSALPHLRSVRLISQQYGDFKIDNLGQLGRVYYFEDLVASIVRTAHHLFAPNEEEDEPLSDFEADLELQRWWLPMRHYRHHTYLAINIAINELAREHAPWIKPNLRARLFTGNEPAWLDALCDAIQDDDITAALQWLFTVEPNSAQAWVDNAEHLTAIGLEWPDPDPDQLFWGIQPKRVSINLIELWCKDVTYLDEYFYLLDRTTGTSEEGSTIQISLVEDNRATSLVMTVSAQVDTTSDQFSIAACYPPTSFDLSDRRTDIRLATIENIQEVRSKWVNSDAKH